MAAAWELEGCVEGKRVGGVDRKESVSGLRGTKRTMGHDLKEPGLGENGDHY